MLLSDVLEISCVTLARFFLRTERKQQQTSQRWEAFGAQHAAPLQVGISWSESDGRVARIGKDDWAMEPDGADDQLDHRERDLRIAFGGGRAIGKVGARCVFDCWSRSGGYRGLFE
jgi:hypothetical protein